MSEEKKEDHKDPKVDPKGGNPDESKASDPKSKGKGKNSPGTNNNKPGKNCPKNKGKKTENNPAWFRTPAAKGRVGINTSILQKIGTTRGVLTNGVRLDAAVLHQCIVAPPMDLEDSYLEEISGLYQDIREKNSGASNYTALLLAAYDINVRALRAKARHALKVVSAIETMSPGNADSPNLLLNVVDKDKVYVNEAAVLADTKNRLALQCARIMALPVVKHNLLEHDKLLFESLFIDDDKRKKPSYQTFRPDVVWWAKYTEPGNQHTPTVTMAHSDIATTLATDMDEIDAILAEIYSDTTGKYTILRGDIRNAFGNAAMLYTLDVNQQIPYKGYDQSVASKVKNAAMLGTTPSGRAADHTCTLGFGITALTVPLSGITNSPIESVATLNERLIDFPPGVDGRSIPPEVELELMALQCVAEKVNETTSSKWNVIAHPGVVLMDDFEIKTPSMTAAAGGYSIGRALDDCHSSTQSTMETGYLIVNGVNSIVRNHPFYITKGADTEGYVWDVGDYGKVGIDNVHNAMALINRALNHTEIPRGEKGRKETKA